MIKKLIYLPLIASTFVFTSCNSDDNSSTPKVQLETPTTYEFVRNNMSTVNFNGQNERLLMAKELLSTMGEFENLNEQKLQNQLNHQAGNNDFSNAELNASNKNILSKIAASKELFSNNSNLSAEIKADFTGWVTDFTTNVVPRYQDEASQGVAGQLVVGGKTRYVNAKGFEMDQLIAKGLIGALIADQTLNNYLSSQVLDAGDNVTNNNNDVVLEGKNYTTMEHKWDEAYGYIFGGDVTNQANPYAEGNSKHNRFLHNYSMSVAKNPNFAGIDTKIFNAFKLGRFAITKKKYDVRNEQVKILRENLSKVIAVRAIHYLISGKTKIEAGERKASFHALSEAYGFVYSLQFTHNPATNKPYLSHDEVESMISKLEEGNGFWSVTPATLQNIAEMVASKFDFTVEQAK